MFHAELLAKKLEDRRLHSNTNYLSGRHRVAGQPLGGAFLRGTAPEGRSPTNWQWQMAEPAPAGSPGQARPRSPSKVRRLAENWHSAPIIEDNEQPHPLLNEDHLAAVAKRPE